MDTNELKTTPQGSSPLMPSATKSWRATANERWFQEVAADLLAFKDHSTICRPRLSWDTAGCTWYDLSLVFKTRFCPSETFPPCSLDPQATRAMSLWGFQTEPSAPTDRHFAWQRSSLVHSFSKPGFAYWKPFRREPFPLQKPSRQRASSRPLPVALPTLFHWALKLPSGTLSTICAQNSMG